MNKSYKAGWKDGYVDALTEVHEFVKKNNINREGLLVVLAAAIKTLEEPPE